MGKYVIDYVASDDEIEQMLSLDSEVFDKKDHTDKATLKKWLKINRSIYTILKQDDKIVGYINFTAITKECYDKFRIGQNKDYKITPNDILPFKKGDNYCLFTSIAIRKEFRNNETINALWDGFIKKINRLKKQGKNITSLIVDCVGIDEIEFALNHLHGKYICNSADWGKIYEGKILDKKVRFPKIKLIQLNKRNLKTMAKIQYEIFKESNSVGYSDYKDELQNNGKVGEDFAISYLIYYQNKPVGVIGLIKYAKYTDDIFLNWFGVLPEYRGRGIGTSALFEVLRIAKGCGVKYFRLYSYVLWHKIAQNIYRKTMQLEESYTNKEDAEVIKKQGETYVFSTSLVDKVAPSWDNRFLNLNSEIILNNTSIEKLKQDKII